MEHNPHNKDHLKESILKKIKLDELKMRPRLYFSAQLVALVLCAILVGVVSAFLFNFLLFYLSASGRSILLGFGRRGVYSFLRLFPWWLLVLDLVLIFGLAWLVRQFSFGYKRPVLYILLVLLAGVFGIGVFLNLATDLNDRLEQHDRHGAFEHARRPPPPPEGICRCTITAINGNRITAEDTYFGATSTYTILLPPNSARATTSGLRVGDTIFVVGDAENDVIRAFGVQKVN
jgi:hypothetical protein